MKTLDQLQFTPVQWQALDELRCRLTGSFGISAMSLYGSHARGEAEAESDIDLLIITDSALPRTVRHQITDIVFEVNLKYDTNFSTLVVDKASWEHGMISVLPIRAAIQEEGISL